MGLKSSQITTTIQESTSTAYPKVMASTIGRTVVFTKVISVMEQDMVMEFGRVRIKRIWVRIGWTIRRDLGCILGRIRKYTRGNLETTIGTGMGRYIR